MQDYFSLFGLVPKFSIDIESLRKQYLNLSRKFHPDFFTEESPEMRDQALEMTAKLNKAYGILKDPLLRIAYLLRLNGILPENTEFKLSPSDPEFLMEMMDLNERIEDLSGPGTEFESIQNRLTQMEKETLETLFGKMEKAEQQAEAETEYKEAAELYAKQRYLLRLRESLNKFATL
jgi:molecular chaperone HscB